MFANRSKGAESRSGCGQAYESRPEADPTRPQKRHHLRARLWNLWRALPITHEREACPARKSVRGGYADPRKWERNTMFTLRKPGCPTGRHARPSRSDARDRSGRAGLRLHMPVRFALIACLGASVMLLGAAARPRPAEALPSLGSANASAISLAQGDLLQRVKKSTEKSSEEQDSKDKQETQKESTNECGRGLYSSKGHCCARGTIWNGKRCLRHAGLQPECAGGNCRTRRASTCPTGTYGHFPNCRNIQTCPAGTVGAPPNCHSIQANRSGSEDDVCPSGFIGVPPDCRRISSRPCPAGTVGAPGRCTVLQAPRAVPRPISI